jgi:hypothetical protein
MDTPVAFLIFNRPDTTVRVFEAIRQAQPPQLLVVADGARPDRPGEAEQCAQTRAVIDRVDWDCQVLTNFSDRNLGCRQRLSSGLNWVFETVEAAIILEDDCLPHPSFFPFCETLLEKYRQDDRIFSISGQNVQWGKRWGSDSYYFSRYFHSWGWASWRRAWQHYDVQMKGWPDVKQQQFLQEILSDRRAVQYWERTFEETYSGKINTWDTQCLLTCWLNHMLCITPNVNLISNIGFGAAATHTAMASGTSPYANMLTEAIPFPLQHPDWMVRHADADRFTQTTLYDVHLMQRALRKAQRLLKWKH